MRMIQSSILAAGLIALSVALSGAPATAQVGEADKCVKVHQTKCRYLTDIGHYMGLYLQNTCSRDITAFWRIDYHNAEHPQLVKQLPDKSGVPWGYRSEVIHFQPRKVPPATINKFKHVPCWKKLHYVYCAEYNPDNYRGLTTSAYLKALPKSLCYSSIIKDPPETRDGTRFHRLTEFFPMVGGRPYSSHFKGKAAQTHHISKLPKPAK